MFNFFARRFLIYVAFYEFFSTNFVFVFSIFVPFVPFAIFILVYVLFFIFACFVFIAYYSQGRLCTINICISILNLLFIILIDNGIRGCNSISTNIIRQPR